MQFSYRRLTALYICVTVSQSQLSQDNSEGGGELLQSFRLGSPQIEPAGSIPSEKAHVDNFSSWSSSADLSQPPSDPQQPIPVDLGSTQGAAVDGPGATAFDFAGYNSPAYLAQEPEQSISESHQVQAGPPESGQDQGRNPLLASDQIALGCDSSSAGNGQEVLDYPPGLQTERPERRARFKRLRPRQSNVCPAQGTNNPSEISTETEVSINNPNPAFYPGGWLQRGQDIIAGVRLRKLKQCTRDKVTLCCNGPQVGLDVKDCAFCTCVGTAFLPIVIRPRGTGWGTGSANLGYSHRIEGTKMLQRWNLVLWMVKRESYFFQTLYFPFSIISLIKNKQAWPTKLHSSALLIPAELGEDRQKLYGALLPPKGHVIYSIIHSREGY